MTPSKLIDGIQKNIIKENMNNYVELFSNTAVQNVNDDYWKQSLNFFNSLSDPQKSAFFEIMKQVMIDTTSNILGVIDGSSMIEGVTEELILTYGSDNKILSGDLQGIFLANYE